jgi:hypothetical protein
MPGRRAADVGAGRRIRRLKAKQKSFGPDRVTYEILLADTGVNDVICTARKRLHRSIRSAQ